MARNMVSVPKGSRGARYGVPEANIRRSQFNLSCGHKTTFDVSELVPIYVNEVLPGDTFNVKSTALIRIFSPLDAPIMDDLISDIHFFYVPNRIIWDNWHAFLGEHDDAGAQDTDYTVPILGDGTTLTSPDRLGFYMGLPYGWVSASTPVNSLPFRAYRACYNEWYRDQSVIDELTIQTDNGPDTASNSGVNLNLLKSGKVHDYFTSALPYLQKGDAQDILGGATTFDVETAAVQGNNVTVVSGSGQRDLNAATADVTIDTTNTGSALFVDLTGVTISINTLRESIAIQRLLEKDARGGTRPNELIRAHFGVTVPDYRVDRPEYLGGGKGFIQVSPVANTSGVDSTASPSGADEYFGELRGIGVGSFQARFAKSFVEHGWILGIMRVRSTPTYSQGIHRMFNRSTKYDFYWPDLAHLGEQAILNRELYVTNTPATDDATFAYQERWAEYRYGKSLVTGKFHPDVSGSLSFWHLSEDFTTTPSFNQTFIEDATPMDRVISVTTEPHFIADVWHDVKAARPLPVRSIPGIGTRL